MHRQAITSQCLLIGWMVLPLLLISDDGTSSKLHSELHKRSLCFSKKNDLEFHSDSPSGDPSLIT